MEAPKVIYTYPWHQYESQNGGGAQTRYIRANAPELVALVGLAQQIVDYGGADKDEWELAKEVLAAYEALTNG